MGALRLPAERKAGKLLADIEKQKADDYRKRSDDRST
jgi:hypothetical protein